MIENLVFRRRGLVLAVAAVVTAVLALQAFQLDVQASYERMIPTDHPYIVNYTEHSDDLKVSGNVLRVAVEHRDGSIFDADYMRALRKINDALYSLPGVDRLFVESLWTPRVRWTAVTDEGFDGGPVIPDDYDGAPESLERLRRNVERSGEIGRLVATDLRSSIIFVPLLESYPDGRPLDYQALTDAIEVIRAEHTSEDIAIHITGFAQLVGQLIDGVQIVMLFFAVTVLIAVGVLYWYTRCVRSTALVVGSSLVGVVWLLGTLRLFGYDLDPYLVLVPFLIFAIGLSHGAQIMNAAISESARGLPPLEAARVSFRRLFNVGLTALLSDAVGFAALVVIGIPIIRDLAVTASVGVLVLIVTNLVVLPLLMSYAGVSRDACEKRALASGTERNGINRLWWGLDLFTSRRWAGVAVVVALVLGTLGALVSQHLAIGDLDAGAPELRADSRYNRDVAFMNAEYSASSDVLVAMVETPEYRCVDFDTLMRVDALQMRLEELAGVEGTQSFADVVKRGVAGYNEGFFKWYGMPPNQDAINEITNLASRDLFNQKCTLLTLSVFLSDHRAETLERVTQAIESFADENNREDMRIVLGAGNAGIEVATNRVVERANLLMLALVYGAVILLCLLTFRSVAAAACAVLPLMLTSVLCAALMVVLGIGVKVATLPVIALGVGIGVDYALYILAATLDGLKRGQSLSAAYLEALQRNGRVVILAGITLSLGVVTWVLSPIKFQADMGLLLSFMFLWNMLGALILLPALGRFLLEPSRWSRSFPDDVPASLKKRDPIRTGRGPGQ